MSILDRSGTYVGPDGMMIDGVSVLDGASRVRLVVEARSAAAGAAALLAASGRFDHRAPLELAETIEAWILRGDTPDDPPPL